MKTLYISDLDGTLLNENKSLSHYSITTINRLIENGMYFSIATARTNVTASRMLSNVNINVPAVLMNGVIIYDLKRNNYVKIQYLDNPSIKIIISALQKYNISGFMYGIENNKMSTYYDQLSSHAMKSFYDERVRAFNKEFIKIDNLNICSNKGIIYFAIMDSEKKLLPLYNILKTDSSIKMEFYHDIYDNELCYLEIFSRHATKYNAVSYLRDAFHFDIIKGFGDNLNDLPLFKACNEAFAVENAVPEVKKAATSIIPSNKDDGVAKYLAWNYNIQKIF